MESVLELVQTEGHLFKFGTGSGTKFVRLRGRREPISGDGAASGLVSFIYGFVYFAGVIKSEGRAPR